MEQMSGRQEILEKLLNAYARYYNITKFEETQGCLKARCDYFEHNEKYVLSRQANLWTADGEEFLYLFEMPQMTPELYRACEEQVLTDGKTRIQVGPGHMYSHLSAVIVCDSWDPDAVAFLKKARFYKSFYFSLRGWMDYRAIVVSAENRRIEANAAGRAAAKELKKVLYR